MTEPQNLQPARMPGAPAIPQANLLPPHVFARRRVARAGVWLVLVVVLVLFVAIVGAVGARWQAVVAEQQLADVQDHNTSLLNQQQEYSDVPVVLNELKARTDARTLAASTEILWSDYLAAISAATPLDASVDSLSVTQSTILSTAGGDAVGPLSTPGTVGQVAINGRASTIITVSAWEDALNLLPGLVDIEVSAVERADNNGETYYAVSAVMSLTGEAFTDQYAETDEPAETDTATETEEEGS